MSKYIAALSLSVFIANAALAGTVSLADQPISAILNGKTANIAITPSVEYPTAVVNAHKDTTFVPTKIYVGYFDPYKCYTYSSSGYFVPASMASGTTTPQCSNQWSGNLLNFATMQTIDIFRWAMTGGSRLIDLPTNTSDSSASKVVLRRANNNDSSLFPTKTLTSASTPNKYVNSSDLSSFSNTKNVTFESANKGVTFEVTNNNKTKVFNAQVQVCDPTISVSMLESNCKRYSWTSGATTKYAYKPEGLMQQYKDDFRFAMFGYLNRQDSSDPQLDGGVMRAPMKSISVEVNDVGAFVTNPDSALATASSVTWSGAMNYLNNFGFAHASSPTLAGGYKGKDPVSELYAEALRYFTGATSASTTVIPATISANEKENFPVITTGWNTYPAIQNTCDNNYIVGIGDVRTHADKNIYPGISPKNSVEMTSGIISVLDASGAQVNVNTWTDAVGALEGMTSPSLSARNNVNGDGLYYNFATGDSTGSACCTGNGFYIAGLGYWAHTNDVNGSLAGKQTISTFWVDVLESSVYVDKNQYWLATKYGGFNDANKNNLLDAGEWNANGTKAGTFDLPDNYYAASDAAKLVSGLSATFQKINAETKTTAAAAGASPNFTASGNSVYTTQYDSSDWSGSVTKQVITGFDSSGNPNSTTSWNARTQINLQNWDTGRKILTFGKNTTSTTGVVPFRISATPPTLTAAELATLGGTAAEQQAVLNYLRGDTSNETTKYRKRTYRLGDIVASQVAIVGPPSAPYKDSFNPGYGTFKATSRNTALYVGANDGMMHVLDDSTGNELWAYVPSYLFEGSFTEATGVDETDGLATLSQKTYAHHYFVNATPAVRDVDFSRTDGQTPVAAGDWHSILVSGLGKGGKSYFALDVTIPVASGTAETSIVSANKVLWEFTDPDLGFSYGQPVIAKTERWGWVVIFSSGYNNVDGKGYIFVVNPKTGALIKKAATSLGDATTPSGMTELTGFVYSYSDYTIKEVYGGDLLGNVWRFNLPPSTDATGTIGIQQIAHLQNGSNNQPITIAPWVDIAKDGKRYVMVGTGRALDTPDVYPLVSDPAPVSYQVQSVYAIRDGNNKTPFSSSTLPTGVTFPFARSNLVEVTDLLNGAIFSANASNVGWYYDLASGSTTTGTERVLQNFTVNADGTVAWLGQTPNSGNVCQANWSSAIYAVNMGTGQSVLRNASGILISKWTSPTELESLSFVRVSGSGGTTIGLGSTKPDGSFGTNAITFGTSTAPSMINWRTVGE